MQTVTLNLPFRTRLSLALASVLLLPFVAQAQDQQTTNDAPKKLDTVVVTGSLIPQSQLETFVPATIITAKDLQARGFSSVAEALKSSSFATGGVQNNQSSGAFTQGAETLSLFGLSASYVKFLIDGRPMANYPALYNGTDVFNNLSSLPVELVDRIEILPGGQSSLYGSDAIAGVINIILKKDIDGSVLSGRIGGYSEGGGKSGRLGFATQLSSADNRWNTLLGVQAEKANPIWAYDRALTRQFNTQGYNGDPTVASRDWAIFDVQNQNSYLFLDPANCANLGAAFDGSVGKRTRAGKGDYCGSFTTPGYRTLRNDKQSAQLYAHSTFDINDRTQVYADVLLNDETVKYHTGASLLWWGTEQTYGAIYDPNLGKLVNLQRSFAPEETGNWKAGMNRNKSTSYSVTAGVNGVFSDESNWDYDVSLTRTEYKLTESSLVRLTNPINTYFQQHVLGQQQGVDPITGLYPVFTPDYTAFYKLISKADFDSFTGRARSHSDTYDNLLRAQLTNGALFSLPGGDAGLAIAAEAGSQGWRYSPDALLMNGGAWGTKANSGSGRRTRHALTTELRLPLWDALTVSTSGRYDAFRAAGRSISKPTYSFGIEYRPFQSLLLRGKVGTAFKAPTLADQFQGASGFFATTVDYYNCAKLGHNAGDIANCPSNYADVQYEGAQTGNPDLEPINAKVWSYGLVWAPSATFSMSADYNHWNIRNEVALQNVDQLMRDEANCRLGILNANSGTCQAALSQVTRTANGDVQKIVLHKVNVAREQLDALTVTLNYRQDLGSYGVLALNGSWTRNFEHLVQQYPSDPVIDALNDPYYSADAKYKANLSASWNKDRWTTTLSAFYLGATPNYRASLDPSGYALAGAGKLGSYTTFNGSVNFDVNDALQLSFLVNNIGNRVPDMDKSYPGTSTAPYNAANYDALGRAFYLEAKWSFGKAK